MLTTKLSRRQVLRNLGLAAVGAVLAACTAESPQPTPAGTEVTVAATQAVPTVVPAPPKKVHIVHYARNVSPQPADAVLAEGEVRRVALEKIAAAYTEAHPNVEFEWYATSWQGSTGYVEWLLARMTAQDAPDVWWGNAENIWPHINKGWALPFTQYLDMPNPYVSGNTAWRDQFEQVAINSQIGPDGREYGVNMDGAGVMELYNKEAFAEAGIDTVPKKWHEFIAACQKLQEKGYIPYGGNLDLGDCCWFEWDWSLVYCQLVPEKIWTYDDDHNGFITGKELAVHSQKGDWPDWPNYLKAMQLMKELAQFLPPGFQGALDFRQLFRQRKVAFLLEGNYSLPGYKADPPPFEIAWMDFPIITKDVHADANEKLLRIMGPWGSLQYHVTGYLAQNDPDKVPVIMDWLMYMAQPDNVTAICRETNKVPLTKGAQATEDMAPFLTPFDWCPPHNSWEDLSATAKDAEFRIASAYLPGTMSDDELVAMAKSAWAEELKKSLESNPDWVI